MRNEVPLGKLDDEVFSRLVLDYRERIFLLILKYVRNRDDARDLTQDVFVRAYRSREGFRGESSPYTWLYRIAVNLALNFKSRGRDSSLVSIEESPEPVRDEGISQSILGRELAQRIDSAVTRLPARQRMVFVLRYYEDKPHAEIAGLLGITEGAVKANFHQALTKLREGLAPYLKGEI